FVRNALVVWPQHAIQDRESDARQELSCGYRYTADMSPGSYEGEPYDGVMRDIQGNHVALVTEGRAGSDVVVGDAMPPEEEEFLIMAKTSTISRQGLYVGGALQGFLRDKLALDAKVNVRPIIKDITAKNFAASKLRIFRAVKQACDGKLAADASIEELAELLDVLEAHPDAIDADPPPQPQVETTDAGLENLGEHAIPTKDEKGPPPFVGKPETE